MCVCVCVCGVCVCVCVCMRTLLPFSCCGPLVIITETIEVGRLKEREREREREREYTTSDTSHSSTALNDLLTTPESQTLQPMFSPDI